MRENLSQPKHLENEDTELLRLVKGQMKRGQLSVGTRSISNELIDKAYLNYGKEQDWIMESE